MERIVSAIKKKNESRDTIIMFQSDNGAVTYQGEQRKKGSKSLDRKIKIRNKELLKFFRKKIDSKSVAATSLFAVKKLS